MKWLFIKNRMDHEKLYILLAAGVEKLENKRVLFCDVSRKTMMLFDYFLTHNFQKIFFTGCRKMCYATALNKECCSVNFISCLFWACFHRKTLRVDHLTTSTRLMITPFPRQQKRREKQ